MRIPGPIGESEAGSSTRKSAAGRHEHPHRSTSPLGSAPGAFTGDLSSWQLMLRDRSPTSPHGHPWPKLDVSLATISTSQQPSPDTRESTSDRRPHHKLAAKFPRMALLVGSCELDATGHSWLRLKDPTGEVAGTLHRDCQGLGVVTGATILARDVPILLSEFHFGLGTGFFHHTAHQHSHTIPFIGGLHITLMKRNMGQIFPPPTQRQVSMPSLDPLDVYDLPALRRRRLAGAFAGGAHHTEVQRINQANKQTRIKPRPANPNANRPTMAPRRVAAPVDLGVKQEKYNRRPSLDSDDDDQPGSPHRDRPLFNVQPVKNSTLLPQMSKTPQLPSVGSDDLDALLDGLDSD